MPPAGGRVGNDANTIFLWQMREYFRFRTAMGGIVADVKQVKRFGLGQIREQRSLVSGHANIFEQALGLQGLRTIHKAPGGGGGCANPG